MIISGNAGSSSGTGTDTGKGDGNGSSGSRGDLTDSAVICESCPSATPTA